MNNLTVKEVELTKISLNPGEVLAVKIISDEIEEQDLGSLKEQLKKLFPSNKAMLFLLPTGSDITFTAMESVTDTCGPKTCADCNCGKANNQGDQNGS